MPHKRSIRIGYTVLTSKLINLICKVRFTFVKWSLQVVIFFIRSAPPPLHGKPSCLSSWQGSDTSQHFWSKSRQENFHPGLFFCFNFRSKSSRNQVVGSTRPMRPYHWLLVAAKHPLKWWINRK